MTLPQMTQVRQRPHRTRIWLSVYQPGTVLAARINQPGVGLAERVLTTVTVAGDPSGVQRGMTCYIGTTPGSQDLGRIRAISATPTTITLAENSITWTDGWYLTVVAYYEPWAVFPRILLDAANIPLFYKDYDIAYTDQNQNLDPVVSMGPHHAGFIVTGSVGALGIYYSASGSFNVADESIPTGYGWTFEGGTPTASFVHTPGYVQYSGAGHFTTSLTVLGHNAKTFTARRHISIYTRPDEGPRPPILLWSLQAFDGSRDDGGYTVRIAVHEQADLTRVVDGALIVLFTDAWEGGVGGKVAAGAENRNSILFVGYIDDDSIRVSPQDNVLEFNARSITGIASRLASYSATLESKTSAMTWNEFHDLTVDKAVIHFLRWHSTLLTIADFSPSDMSATGVQVPVQYADFSRGDLYAGVNGLYQSAMLGSLVSDRQGKMWAERDLSLMPTGTARLLAVGTGTQMTRQDWRSQLTFGRYAAFERMAYVELGGIGYAGPQTGTFGAYIGAAPGEAAGYHGNVERASGLVLTGQDDVNRLAGLSYARANADFPEIEIPIAGDYRFIDIAPQSRLLMTMEADENYRGLVWTNKPFVPYEISHEYRHQDQALMMSVRAREETEGPKGIKIEIPIDPPYDDFDLPDWKIEFPPFIPFPPIFPPILPPPGTGNMVYALINGLLGRTRNFFDPSPHWEAVPITGPTGSLTSAWSFFVLDPAEPTNRALLGTQVGGIGDAQGPRIYVTGNLSITGSPGPSWAEVWGQADNEALDLTSFQRQILATPEKRADGLWHFPFGRRSLAGIPVYVYGSPGAWTKVDIGTTAHNYQSDHWANLAQVGATIYWVSHGRMWQNNKNGQQPSAWQIKRTTGGGDIAWGVFAPSGNPNLVLWLEGLGTPDEFRFSPEGGGPGTPSVIEIFGPGGGLYEGIAGEGGFETIRQIPGIPGVYYMFVRRYSGSGPLGLFGVFSTSAGFTARATFNATSLGPVTVMPTNPLKLASFGRTGASGARIMGSADGGYTWYDKTGDWATQIGAIGDAQVYKSIQFAFTV